MSKVLVSRLQWLLLAVSFGAGCAARFDTLPRIFENGAASSQTDDVRLMGALVDGVSRPCECPAVAAILVAIQNGSDRLLSVRYENFVLRWVAGNALRPLPAFNLEDANGVGMPVSYAYPWSGFWLAAPLGQYYRGFWGGATNLSRDAAYYTTQHAANDRSGSRSRSGAGRFAGRRSRTRRPYCRIAVFCAPCRRAPCNLERHTYQSGRDRPRARARHRHRDWQG
jgi:hypothetical protein